MTKRTLTQDTLKKLLSYDPDTGDFTWLERDAKWFKCSKNNPKESHAKTWNSRFAGKLAGAIGKHNGYQRIQISLMGNRCKAHRLAWLYVYGYWPTEILHDDQDGTNNRIANLSEGTHADNMRNLKCPTTNTSGVTGICWQKDSSKWRVRFRHMGGFIEGGSLFTNFDDAVIRLNKLRAAHNIHPNHGQAAV